MSSHILDVPLEESEEILATVWAALYVGTNVYVHHWQPFDVIIWNKVAIQHGRPATVGNGTRDLWRLLSYVRPTG